MEYSGMAVYNYLRVLYIFRLIIPSIVMAIFLSQEFDLLKKDEAVQILSYEKQEDYIVFNITVQIGSCSWIVKHRYSDFVEFDKARFTSLKDSFLPPKKLVNNQNSEFLDKRQKELESYLRTVFELEVLLQRRKNAQCLPRPFSKFLDFQKYEVHSIMEDLAERLYKTDASGETSLASENYKELSPLLIWAVTERLKLAEPTCGGSDAKLDFGHVVDFMHRLERLKISGSKDLVACSNIRLNDLPFSLNCFKNLRRLWLSSVNTGELCGLETVQRTCEVLIAHHCLHHLQDIITTSAETEVGSEDQLDAVPSFWTAIKRSDFSKNWICDIDDSIKQMRSVQILNLSHNQLTDILHLEHLICLTELNLSHNRIERLTNWHLKLGNVKKLILANNKITSLTGLAKLYSLEFLDVRNNNILHAVDVWPVGKLPCLMSLLQQGNPIEAAVEYRTKVLEAFGERASEIKLDGSLPSQRELDTVAVRLAIRKAKEDREKILRRANDEISRSLSIISFSGEDDAFGGEICASAPPSSMNFSLAMNASPNSALSPPFDLPSSYHQNNNASLKHLEPDDELLRHSSTVS